MRVPFAAGSLRGKTSKLFFPLARAAAPFPGPWTLAAIIRTLPSEPSFSLGSGPSANMPHTQVPYSRRPLKKYNGPRAGVLGGSGKEG